MTPTNGSRPTPGGHIDLHQSIDSLPKPRSPVAPCAPQTYRGESKYNKLIGTKSTEPAQPAEGSEVSTPPTVNELLVEFLEYAQAYYRHQDAAAKTYSAYVIAAKWLRQDAGRELAEDFGPKRLRKGMIVDQCNA